MDFSAFDSDATINEFLDEARGNIDAVNQGLLQAERGQLPADAVHAMFRGAHSLKGLAGMFNLGEVCRTTHALETVLDRIRKGQLEFSRDVVAAGFDAVDLLGGLLDDLAERRSGERSIATTVRRLQAIAPAPADAAAARPWSGLPESLAGVLAEVDLAALEAGSPAGAALWLLRLPIQELLQRDRDLVQTWRELERALTVLSVHPLARAEASPLSALDRFDYQVVLLASAEGDIQDRLAPLVLPRHDGWRLDLAARSAERRIFLPTPAAIPAETRIAVKDGMEQHLAAWVAETREELEQLDAALLGLEAQPEAVEPVQIAFRMAHRIKGSAGTMGLEAIARVAHNLEWALDLLRTHRLPAGGGVAGPLLAICDWLSAATQAVEAGASLAPGMAAIEAALAELGQQAAPAAHTGRMVRRWMPEPGDLDRAHAEAGRSGAAVWLASVELRHDCRLPDLRCRLILGHLARIGTVVSSRPPAGDLAAGVMTGRQLRLLLATRADEEAIRDCLLVDEVLRCDLELLPQPSAAIQAVPAPPTTADPGAGPAAAPPPEGEAHPARSVEHTTGLSATVRVESSRIDQLMNVAGEMVVAKARIAGLSDVLAQQLGHPVVGDLRALCALLRDAGVVLPGFAPERIERIGRWVERLPQAQATTGDLAEAVVALHRSTSALQTSAMQMRMVPVTPLFQRFHRVVRDLCRELGKSGRLETSGEATELDKKLIDELVDPLTHLVRNALDHGLEPAAERLAGGKPEQGTVTLSAFQEGGQICIRISDDGRGIDPARIRAKAVEKGLFSPAEAAAMSDQEALAIIFLPGFSTAATVSNVSGRGVGMDIVRAKIAELKGTVDIDSVVGRGSRFTIRLPLTLAMIKALLVEIGGERLALPLDAVREIVELPTERIHAVDGHCFMPLRDHVMALADLPRLIGLRPHRLADGRLRAVIVKGGREAIAIPVDRVLREEEIVVKALPGEFAQVRGLAGASILGDGGIALILDLSTIVQLAVDRAGGSHA